MSAIPKSTISPEAYLARERAAKFKSEYYRGEVFAMAGASFEHTLIKDNIALELGTRFRDRSCFVMTSDMRVKIDQTGLYTYPDIVMVCEKPKFEDDHFDTLQNPQVLIEVLSNSTEKYDRGEKFKHYREISTLKEYVLVSQDQSLIERYARQADGTWILTIFEGLNASFQFATIQADILMAAIYRSVIFPASGAAVGGLLKD